MKLGATIPILRVFDHALARVFYVEWLGFRIDWEHQTNAPAGPLYWQVSRDGCVLHLSGHYGDCTPGGKIMVAVDDVEAYHRELGSRPNAHMNPGIEVAPWNAKVMTVIDPFGNQIAFEQRL